VKKSFEVLPVEPVKAVISAGPYKTIFIFYNIAALLKRIKSISCIIFLERNKMLGNGGNLD
jgi:hypothetical protein